MMKRILFRRAAQKLLMEYGEPFARKMGNKAACHMTEKARQKGYLDKSYDLETLAEELKEGYRQGRLNREEFERVMNLVRDRIGQKYRKRSK